MGEDRFGRPACNWPAGLGGRVPGRRESVGEAMHEGPKGQEAMHDLRAGDLEVDQEATQHLRVGNLQVDQEAVCNNSTWRQQGVL